MLRLKFFIAFRDLRSDMTCRRKIHVSTQFNEVGQNFYLKLLNAVVSDEDDFIIVDPDEANNCGTFALAALGIF
jgi:hypothetical protein